MVKQPANIIIQHIVKCSGLDDFTESPQGFRTAVEHRAIAQNAGRFIGALLGSDLPAVTARFTVIHWAFPRRF